MLAQLVQQWIRNPPFRKDIRVRLPNTALYSVSSYVIKGGGSIPSAHTIDLLGYRRGHNEAVLKTVGYKRHVGSNPTPSVQYFGIVY